MDEVTTISILSAIICGIIANKQDRTVGWGIFFGLMFGVFAIIVYLIIGDKKD